MTASTVLPDKLFFRIGEVAGLVGVEPHVLRYWEREFRSIRPTKSKKGQRVYSRKDVENLFRVRDLLYRDGFTIAGAKKKLQRGAGDGDDALADTHDADASGTLEPSPSVDEVAAAVAPRPASPHLAPPARGLDPRTREQLHALRSEIEAFLIELGGATDSAGNSRRPPAPK